MRRVSTRTWPEAGSVKFGGRFAGGGRRAGGWSNGEGKGGAWEGDLRRWGRRWGCREGERGVGEHSTGPGYRPRFQAGCQGAWDFHLLARSGASRFRCEPTVKGPAPAIRPAFGRATRGTAGARLLLSTCARCAYLASCFLALIATRRDGTVEQKKTSRHLIGWCASDVRRKERRPTDGFWWAIQGFSWVG